MCGDEGGHAHDGGDGGGILCALDLAKLSLSILTSSLTTFLHYILRRLDNIMVTKIE